ncbi:MAG: ATP-binding protein [Thermodesulfobacteriota bacterium]
MTPSLDEESKNSPADHLLRQRLQWLMFLRVLFTTLLLGATILVQLKERPFGVDRSLAFLYSIIAGTYLLTLGYVFLFSRIKLAWFALFQLIVDTFQVSLIIYVTGSYASVFSFLYLVVIIYASIFTNRAGILTMAISCSIQYGLLLVLEFFQVLPSFEYDSGAGAFEQGASLVVFKIAMTTVACFLVAVLSGLLSEQERKTQKELSAVREHVRRVEKMAAIGEMAARLAHEIKNPMASLMGAARMLSEEMPSETSSYRLFGIILREADRLNCLLTDFLHFARPVVPSLTPMDLSTAVNETVELFRKDRDVAQKVHLVLRTRPDLWIEMDPHHFRQVLWNLLANAGDALEEEGEVSVSTDLGPEGMVYLVVADTGKGMDEETQQHIFEPFFTTKRKGSGLGLSIVHRILTAYGFRLDLDSRLGRGTTFTIVARKAQPVKSKAAVSPRSDRSAG